MTKMKKLSLALAALAISGTLSGPVSALSNTDVQQIRNYVESGDDEGLRAFLLQNLPVLDGSPLAVMLREYIQTPPEETIFVSLGFQSSMPEALRDIVEQTKTDSSLY